MIVVVNQFLSDLYYSGKSTANCKVTCASPCLTPVEYKVDELKRVVKTALLLLAELSLIFLDCRTT